jgi:hypothetical protein
MVECGVFFDKPYSRGANTPHLNPLPYTTTGLLREYDAQRVLGLRSIRLGSPPRGEERKTPSLFVVPWRDRSLAARPRETPIYVSAKRTHRSGRQNIVEHPFGQRVTSLQSVFAGGFVLENEPTGEAVFGRSVARKAEFMELSDSA